MYKGWTRRGKPFTKDEYLNSYLYKNTKRSYNTYLMHLKRNAIEESVDYLISKEKKTPKPLKKTEPKTPR